ncbi:hypothetical protein J8L98_22010 [Pseudoalteromonas sp. MMG013]|uniref:hypothetical protein n=1 Tax=Pseudoalteromonas sp. MMG013 TaxID=2822687 RepID=UPI001B364B75|nr:hypothetical protein [Pseudoalteromonas sp. MMG013]MBQ4864370.1 hypothetical protein [Pseudoalteromonas sp. MMG013]
MTHEQIEAIANDEPVQQAVVTYQNVQTKIALRHPQAQINEALLVAIAHEQTTFDDAHAKWVIECEQVQKAIDAANTHNDTNPEEPKPIPELPAEPVIDLTLRRACYNSEHVAVDLALTIEAEPAKVVFDDDALIAYHHPATEAHSAEHIEQVKRSRFKAQRNINVSNIAVEVDGMVFDGDEVSQTRMSRAILLMSDTDSLTWVLNDNSVASVSKKQLTDACLLAAAKQSELWVI